MKTYSRHDFTREKHAARAKVAISAAFESKEQAFLDFVLSHYVRVGVQELDQEKLTPLLRLKYNNSIADAVADLGKPEDIGRVFIGFQKYLYQQVPKTGSTDLYFGPTAPAGKQGQWIKTTPGHSACTGRKDLHSMEAGNRETSRN